MKFQDWIKGASEDLGSAIESKSHELDIWEGRLDKDSRKVYMLPYYVQYKM